ncbi:caspase, EACC1-associated type [Streptomyces sp. P1-3]|uniref:caspase family protein n=1 Tax=Streptomyces sp. P1-3 TaxID=3421658 RepID=UPI003D3679EC
MRLPDRDRSRAVLIGVGGYTSPALPDVPAVHNNVRDLRRELTRTRGGAFHPEHCVEIADPVEGHGVGRQLLHAARQAEDVFLVYYAGHGLVGQRRRELYLALVETDPDALIYTALSFEGVREAFLASPAKNRILLLDCCFSGRAIGEHLSDDVSAVMGQIDISGTYILTSAPANEPAVVAPGARHTAFTGELISLLREGIPGAASGVPGASGASGLTLDALYRGLHRSLTGQGLPAPQRCGTETAQELVLTERTPVAPTPGSPPSPGQATPEELVEAGDLEEAVAAYRPLAEGDLATYGEMFAAALLKWGVQLTREGRHEEARAADAEAVGVYRTLVKADATRYRPHLAKALRHLSFDLKNLGRMEGARSALEESVRLFRMLAGQDPLLHRGDLAKALERLGAILTRLGRQAKASVVYDELAGLYRAWVEEGEPGYRWDLAWALGQMADILSGLDQHEKALLANEESVSRYRELATEDPTSSNEALANELGVRRRILTEVGRLDEALEVSDEAVDIYRVLAEESPQNHRGDLVDALVDYGVALTNLDRHKEALEADTEAVDLLRLMAKADPGAYRHTLAWVLENLSIDLRELDREEEAQKATEEAEALRALDAAEE